MITCQFENGHQANLRHITVNAIVVKENQILLGKRANVEGKIILEAGKWALLGGFMGRDETLQQAVRREVLEESGWEIGSLELFCINDNPNRPAEDRQNVDVIFLAQAVKPIGKSDDEVSNLAWFPIDQLPAIDQIAFDHADHLIAYQTLLQSKERPPLHR